MSNFNNKMLNSYYLDSVRYPEDLINEKDRLSIQSKELWNLYIALLKQIGYI
jgi:hypothetical protein